ncbi:sensor histidine kinase [Paenibacillus sp. NPDC058071]|uniref:sensor histidine kinase n=1 Tax=Paenibacillus sp. NPDC058071 TaxID=3346326 RepID=UPI0036D84AD0
MSIRRRLYLSYVAMAFVPFLAISCVMLIFIYSSGYQDIRAYFKEEGDIGYHQAFVAGELNFVLETDASEIEKASYTAKLDEKMTAARAGFIVFKEGAITYRSSYVDHISTHENWERYAAEPPPEELTLNQYRYQTSVISFAYSDGSNGEIMLLLRKDVVPMYWKPIFGLTSFFVIGLTIVVLTYLVSRSIIRPIAQLKKAALQMKEGDLSSIAEIKAKGEVGELSTAFEEMRIRLKTSIDQSLLYEENRKMLLSHISHDLKTPISAIKGYVEGIMDGIANTEEKRDKYYKTIYRKATDMDQIIDELFLFSKLDMQKVAFDFKVIDLRGYLREFLEEQRFDLEKVEIRLETEGLEAKDGPVMAAADQEKLGRVLTNILSNSVKYMAQSGEEDRPGDRQIHVILETRAEQGYTIITLADNGPGIDSEDLPHIFEGFYRAEQSRNSETGGSGLGLAIVKQIIEGHGGRVWAENAASGGMRFCLQLPVAAPAKDGEKQ